MPPAEKFRLFNHILQNENETWLMLFFGSVIPEVEINITTAVSLDRQCRRHAARALVKYMFRQPCNLVEQLPPKPDAQSGCINVETYELAETPDGQYFYADDLTATDADIFVDYVTRHPDRFDLDEWRGATDLPYLVTGLGSVWRRDGELAFREDWQSITAWARFQAKMAYLEDGVDPLHRLSDEAAFERLLYKAIRSGLPTAVDVTFTLRYARRRWKVRMEPRGSGIKIRGSAEASAYLTERIGALGAGEWLTATLRTLGDD